MLRKSQISVFIILGILIIAIFGFMFFITSQVGKIKLETQANKILDSILSTTPINYYVTLCLEEGTKRALNVSGMHGGLIELSENNKKTEFNGANVSYYLMYEPGATNYPPDIYPCNPQTNPSKWNISSRYCAFLNNISRFTYLNETKLGITDFKVSEYQIAPMLLENCWPDDSPCREMKDEFNISIQGIAVSNEGIRFAKDPSSTWEPTIQKQIEEYIANYTYECSKGILNASASNLSAFTKFEVNVSNISVNAVFGFNGVEVSADYPIVIKIQNVEPVIRILKFSYFSPVRYKYVYMLARWIAEQEMKELDFDIIRDWRRFPPHVNYKLNFDVATQNTSDGDTLVMISDIDNNHYLRNGPFQLLFAIKNRPPVLDYIPGYQDPTDYGLVFSRDYDVYVLEGETVTIRPKAYDPDGDELNYSYSGWKETEDAYFDETPGPGIDCRNESQVRACVINTPPAPHNWTTSETFTSSYPSASYKTNHSDIGYHVITVCANQTNDPSMADCQNITILVDDVFEVIANATNCYDDITNDSLISKEDPVCLDANVIDYFNPGKTEYLWTVQDGGNKQIYQGSQKLVMLPKDYLADRTPINKYIPGLIDYFTSTGNKIFSLLVTRGTALKSTQLTLEAKNCTPHRTNNPTTKMGENPPSLTPPPYPFNNLSYGGQSPEGYSSFWDPFLANHVCCKGNPSDSSASGWGYESVGTECFNYSEYGWYNSSFLNISEQSGAVIQKVVTSYAKTSQGINENKPTDTKLENDIIKREFLSYCSGNSGNKCSSDVTAKFTNITSCPDHDDIDVIRSCQGANITAKWFDPAKQPACEKFAPNMTFEKYIGEDGGADAGICGKPRCSSDNFSDNTYMDKNGNRVEAYYLCEATCFGGICQKPVNCINCRKEGVCKKEPDALEDYKVNQTINFSSGYCDAVGEDSCKIDSVFTSQTDYCADDINLVEFMCRPSSTKEDQPDINYSKPVNCAETFESDPSLVKITVQSETLFKWQCIPGNMSKCANAACLVNTTEMRSDNILTEDCPGNMFRGIEFEDKDSTGKAESCKYKEPVSPNEDERYCYVCGGTWVTAYPGYCVFI